MKNAPQNKRPARAPAAYTRHGKRPYSYPAWVTERGPVPYRIAREMPLFGITDRAGSPLTTVEIGHPQEA